MFKYSPASVGIQEEHEPGCLTAPEAFGTNPDTELEFAHYYWQLNHLPDPDSEWECT
jgi:hypothetical protein